MKMYRNPYGGRLYLINRHDKVFYWSCVYRSWNSVPEVKAVDVRTHCTLIANNVRLAR